jgi:hypothetical protein
MTEFEEKFDLQHLDRPLVYLAGPYATPDPVENTHKTLRFADRLIEDGIVTPFVPHLTLLWHLVTPRPADFWYAYDFAALTRCDGVFRIAGASTGADAEVDLAEKRGIPVFHDEGDLYSWAKKWSS